jgi:exonuclease SbcC
VRPLSLEISGFRSHEARTCISFEGRSLLAIVGPTGAGKSSLLDALSYALYGKTPRIKRSVKLLICTRSEAAHVRLRFLIDDRPYEITRAVPRTGSGEHVLIDESSGQRYVGAEEVTRRVVELVQLDFDAFCSSVLLAQGQFSVFLDAAPTDRIKILKGVFRLEQIDDLRAAAKNRVGELQLELATIDGELRTIPEDASELLAQERARAATARARVSALGEALPEEKRLEETARAAERDLTEARARVASLAGLHEDLPERARLEALGDEEARLLGELAESEKALAEATAACDAAARARSDLAGTAGAERDLVSARAHAHSRRELSEEIERLSVEMGDHGARVETLTTAAAAADEAERARRAELAGVRAELVSMRRAHAAHALRADLRAGDVCPVCGQDVATVPRTTAPAELADAEGAEAEAEAAVESARTRGADAAGRLSKAQAACEHLGSALDQARERVKLLDERIEGAVGSHPDPLLRSGRARPADVLAEIETRLRMWDEARARVERADAARNAALAARETSRKSVGGFSAKRNEIAVVLIGIAGRLESQRPRVDEPVAALQEHAVALEKSLRAALTQAETECAAAEAHAATLARALSELRSGLDLGGEDTIASALASATAELRVAERGAHDLEAKMERGRELEKKRAATQGRHDIFARLAFDLTDRNFTHFLLEDRRRLLSELGSERLRAMTSRYRFDDEGNFNVVDELDGDKLREISTLSGGETFLASLALALALAEAVQRAGGRLQCFFLDEGFGSLDAESLDLALDGIERIVSHDRLIALVSHVQAIAARVEDRIELDKSPEGMSLVSSGAALG